MNGTDDTIVVTAAHGNTDAARAVLGGGARLALQALAAVTGDIRRANRAVAGIIRLSVRQLPTWETRADVQRWFLRQAVLAARRHADPPSAKGDALLTAAGTRANHPAWRSFMAVLRGLPSQQQEAAVLLDGASLDLRVAAVAMDCSTTATTTHREQARRTIESLCGDQTAACLETLGYAFAHIADDVAAPSVRLVARSIRRHRWGRRFRTLAAALMVVFVIAGLAWAGWTLCHIVQL